MRNQNTIGLFYSDDKFDLDTFPNLSGKLSANKT